MSTAKLRAERRKRQSDEIEANQGELRASIAESERLSGETDNILRRHRKEWQDAETAEEEDLNCDTTDFA